MNSRQLALAAALLSATAAHAQYGMEQMNPMAMMQPMMNPAMLNQMMVPMGQMMNPALFNQMLAPMGQMMAPMGQMVQPMMNPALLNQMMNPALLNQMMAPMGQMLPMPMVAPVR